MAVPEDGSERTGAAVSVEYGTPFQSRLTVCGAACPAISARLGRVQTARRAAPQSRSPALEWPGRSKDVRDPKNRFGPPLLAHDAGWANVQNDNAVADHAPVVLYRSRRGRLTG